MYFGEMANFSLKSGLVASFSLTACNTPPIGYRLATDWLLVLLYHGTVLVCWYQYGTAVVVSAPRVSSSTVPDGPDISDDYGEFLGLSEGIDALVGSGEARTPQAFESTVPIVTDTPIVQPWQPGSGQGKYQSGDLFWGIRGILCFTGADFTGARWRATPKVLAA